MRLSYVMVGVVDVVAFPFCVSNHFRWHLTVLFIHVLMHCVLFQAPFLTESCVQWMQFPSFQHDFSRIYVTQRQTWWMNSYSLLGTKKHILWKKMFKEVKKQQHFMCAISWHKKCAANKNRNLYILSSGVHHMKHVRRENFRIQTS